ncbi:PREDICTED: eukaryotic initiation factor 4A-15 [Prunus dulcis]|uniref:PREDICTED: eukaryotic initiation factor 4A-15 n=1 Tax=Prunus dulcis TaxID=3755 RepID=A0A5E4F906_PRUDU|nr:hypothetical protein L3X38_002179 [Prunus dulcis]VVA24614.1 PREDICTED: eukaryotic initiation factor 4A-15 [Prunus dulcis]
MESYLQGQDLWDVVGGNKATQPREDNSGTFHKWKINLLENELLSVAQCDMTIAQYFHKVKSICRAISELDLIAVIVESRIKRIIIHGLRLEYRGFVAAIQGWSTPPSLVEFGNFLADQDAMAKQIGGVSSKGEEEVLYSNRSKGNFKQLISGEFWSSSSSLASYFNNVNTVFSMYTSKVTYIILIS